MFGTRPWRPGRVEYVLEAVGYEGVVKEYRGIFVMGVPEIKARARAIVRPVGVITCCSTAGSIMPRCATAWLVS